MPETEKSRDGMVSQDGEALAKPAPSGKKGFKVNSLVLLIILVSIIGVCFLFVRPVVTSLLGEHYAPPYVPSDAVEISLNPLSDLDYMTKSDIYALRTRHVMENPLFFPKDYQPREEVFGQIVDGKPWWGILGLSYYGPGEKSIEGDTLQSLYINNPLLLIGLDEGYAHIMVGSHLKPKPIYPKPISLIWSRDGTWAMATFNITELKADQKEYGFLNIITSDLEMEAHNARDMGYNYLYVDTEDSPNINVLSKYFPPYALLDPSGRPATIKHFLHQGASCGYPGGCNNISPKQSEMKFRYSSLPARAHIKLWRSRPSSVDNPADMTYLIVMV